MFPKVGEGFWADAKSGEYHLRLFSTVTELGWAAAVYDMNGKLWVERAWADDADDGTRKAEAIAKAILKTVPPLDWKPAPS